MVSVAALTTLLLSLVTLPNGNHYVKHCRKAPEGCEARMESMANTFVEVATERDIDPLLLISIAYRESGLNPNAVGGRGERGVMQVLPSNFSKVHLEEDPFLIDRATELLVEYIEECKSLNKGLGTYNAGMNLGYCPYNTLYARRVLRLRRRLLK